MARKHIVPGLVVLVVMVFSFAALFIISQRQRYAVKEGTISGVLKISDMGVMSSGGISRPVYLLGDDGNKYRLQKATNQDAHSVIMSAREGDRLKVTGRFWRPRKGKTMVYDGKSMYEGPKMTDDPIDFFEKADFLLLADSVQALTVKPKEPQDKQQDASRSEREMLPTLKGD